MWSWISAPGVSEGATQPFRVASVKTQGAAFLQRMAGLLGGGADGVEGGAPELAVPRLRLVSLDEDIEANLQQAEAPRATQPQAPTPLGLWALGQQQGPHLQQQCQQEQCQAPQGARGEGVLPGSQQQQQQQQHQDEREGEGEQPIDLQERPRLDEVCGKNQEQQERVRGVWLPQHHQQEQPLQELQAQGPTMREASGSFDDRSQPDGQPVLIIRSRPAQEQPRPQPQPQVASEGQAAAVGPRASRPRKRPARFAEYVGELLPAAQRRVRCGAAASGAPTKAAKPAVGGQPGRSQQPPAPFLPISAQALPQAQTRAAEGGPVVPPPAGSAAVAGAQGPANVARQQAQPWRAAGRRRLTGGVPWREGKPQRVALLQECQGVVEEVKRRRQEETGLAAQVLHSVQSVLDLPQVVQAQAALTQREATAKALSVRLEGALTKREAASEQELVGEGEVVVHVSVLLPRQPATSAHPSQELLLLGSQPLTALRDAIHCLTDDNVAATQRQVNDTCQATGQPPVQLAKGGAYLYVEGTFFNDTREPGNADYSESVRRFNREHKIAAPPHPPPGYDRCDQLTSEFSSAAMESTTFDQLWLRLGPGAVNLYCHQGGCEHAIVFKDVRLFDPDTDPPLVSQYPFPGLVPAPGHHRYCEVCSATPAAKVTYDDRHAPHSPYFWCEECFKSMHYDKDGNARYTDYVVFPYTYEHRVQRQGGGWLRP